MTDYSHIILFISAFYSTIVFFRFYAESKRIFDFCLATAAFFLSLFSISDYLVIFFPIISSSFLKDWTTVFSISFVLSAMAAIIREFKPELTRFPRVFTLFPLLLIPVFPIVIETVVLKDYVFNIYKMSALAIGLFIFGYKAYLDSSYYYIVVGIMFFLISLLLYLIPDSLFILPEYGWVNLTAAGVLVFTIGYIQTNKLLLENESQKREGTNSQWFV